MSATQYNVRLPEGTAKQIEKLIKITGMTQTQLMIVAIDRIYQSYKEKQMMQWNSEKEAYFGVTSSGKAIRVEGVEYAESQQDGVDEQTLNDPDVWENLIGDNQNVEYC